MIADAEQGQDNYGGITEAEPAEGYSEGSDYLTAQSSAHDNTEKEESDYIPSKSGLSDSDSGAYTDVQRPKRTDDYS